ncbi:hypothetical protein ACVCIH_30655 [Burkholderia glumae]|uniref:hypothetical protein n=1 Tax=Burkholderia glumae TaxID=337 RepID=UPI0020374FC3|nr:hypothetical protein [Burkholderia glumae]MCM2496035.1 hypothetical protein [Burkholderia glumae]
MKSSSAVAATPARRVDGIVFEIVLESGLRCEVIGVPFEHRGRTFAVHPSNRAGLKVVADYAVSEVETGRRIPRVAAFTIDDARDAAILEIDAVSDADWLKLSQLLTHRAATKT